MSLETARGVLGDSSGPEGGLCVNSVPWVADLSLGVSNKVDDVLDVGVAVLRADAGNAGQVLSTPLDLVLGILPQDAVPVVDAGILKLGPGHHTGDVSHGYGEDYVTKLASHLKEASGVAKAGRAVLAGS